MSKVTLSRLSSLTNGLAAINGLIEEIELAFDKTVFRDGSSPNQLTASLDANSNKILNLPAPATSSEPVRLGDLDNLVTGLGSALRAFTVATDTWASTVTVDWSSASTHRITLKGNTTLVFSGAKDGDRLILELTQDATGSRTVTFPSSISYGVSLPSVTLSTAANKIDKLGFTFNQSTNKYQLIAASIGF